MYIDIPDKYHKGFLIDKVNKGLALTKLLIFCTISVLSLLCIHFYVNTNECILSVPTDSWTSTSTACNNLSFNRRGPILWYDMLKNSAFSIIYLNIGNQSYTYYQNFFFMVVPENVLSVVTFNIISQKLINITILNNTCNWNINTSLLLFKEAGISGYVKQNLTLWGINSNTCNQDNFPIVNPYTVLFFTFNGFVCILLIIYTLTFVIKIAYKEWLEHADYWANLYYSEFKDEFVIHTKIACSPCFLIDHLIGNANKNRIYWSTGIGSSLVYTLIVWSVNILLILFGYYCNDIQIKRLIFAYIVIYLFWIAVEYALYVFNFRWKYRKIPSLLVYFIGFIGILLNYSYFILSLTWFFACILIQPQICAALIIIIASIIYYLINIVSELHILKQIAIKDRNRIDETLKKLGLGTRDIILGAIFGFIILMILSLWIVVIVWYMYNMQSSYAGILTSLSVPILAFYTKTQQLERIKTQMDKKIYGQNNNGNDQNNQTNHNNDNVNHNNDTESQLITLDK